MSTKQERIEDVEDLVRFGATFQEIVERSPYANWARLSRVLRESGRTDLLESLRLKRIGDGAPTGMTPVKRKPVCNQRECGRKVKARGYCDMHYTQLRRKGTVSRKQTFPDHCSVKDCEREHKARGYCGIHAERARRHGSPNTVYSVGRKKKESV